MTADELKAVIEEVFDEKARIDSATHGKHHAWIEARIEREQARKLMYQKVTETAIGWSVPAVLGGLWYWLTHGGQWPS